MILRCQRCRLNKPLPGERYCAPCRRLVLLDMERLGYLEPEVEEPCYDDFDEATQMWYQKRREHQE